MSYTFFTLTNDINQEFEISMNGVVYTITIRYNSIVDRYFVSIQDIFNSRLLFPFVNLINSVNYNISGELILWADSENVNKDKPPKYNELENYALRFTNEII